MHLPVEVVSVFELKNKIVQPFQIKFKIKISLKKKLTVRSLGTKYFFDGRSATREFGARSTITAQRSGYSRRIRSPKFHSKYHLSLKKKFYTFSSSIFIRIINFKFPTHFNIKKKSKNEHDTQFLYSTRYHHHSTCIHLLLNKANRAHDTCFDTQMHLIKWQNSIF